MYFSELSFLPFTVYIRTHYFMLDNYLYPIFKPISW